MQTDLLAGTFISPHTLTILGTYQCTAACKQCCFESSPSVRGRLSGDVILQRITEAQGSFPSLRMVVFSGGEAFLLKDDLFNAVAHCQTLGLHTRIVTNGSWGKREQTAREFAGRLASAGLKEINFSTGKDHQEWVPWNSFANAAHACAEAGISTLITVECDTEERTLTREVTTGDSKLQLHALKRLIREEVGAVIGAMRKTGLLQLSDEHVDASTEATTLYAYKVLGLPS